VDAESPQAARNTERPMATTRWFMADLGRMRLSAARAPRAIR
jgi:hypothetical protein